MPQRIGAEARPEADRLGTIAYFCGALPAAWPPDGPAGEYVAGHRARVRANALDLVENGLAHPLPGLQAANAVLGRSRVTGSRAPGLLSASPSGAGCERVGATWRPRSWNA